MGFFLLLERLFHAFGISHSHWHAEGQENCDHSDHGDSKNQKSNKVENERENGVMIVDIESHEHISSEKVKIA